MKSMSKVLLAHLAKTKKLNEYVDKRISGLTNSGPEAASLIVNINNLATTNKNIFNTKTGTNTMLK